MRYINAILSRICSFIHCSWVKILFPKSFKFHPIELISNSVHFHIEDRGRIHLGNKCGMRRGCEIRVAEKGYIQIRDQVFFNNNCMIVSHNKIVVGEGTRFGPGVMIFDHDYDYSKRNLSGEKCYRSSPIYIGKNVWVGAGSVILRGTTIGDNSVVGAGCILKGDFPSDSMILQKRNTEFLVINRS